MRTVDHQGIHIDQCADCRGIFLDRGELEQMLGAEQRHYGGMPAYESGHADSPGPYRGGRRPGSPGPYRGGRHPDSPGPYREGHGRGRRRSFLEGLFD